MTGAMRAAARGMAAGLVGTIAMTLSERMEMAISGRDPSEIPRQVGASLLPGKHLDRPGDVQGLNSAVHWAHGISMGALRGLLGTAGLHGPTASAAHFALLWGGDAALYRALGVAPAPWHWSGDELATDMFHKGVYAVTTGVVYDALASTDDPAPVPADIGRAS